MKILSANQIRDWDQFTILHEPITSIDLMERAAAKCVQWIEANNYSSPLKIFCGTGNNGGDGLAIARLLMQKNYSVEVFVVESGKEGSRDFKINLERLSHYSNAHFIKSNTDFPGINKDDIIIDALFGSGLSRPITDLNAEIVNHLNASLATVIAIDVPSGLFIDSSSKTNVVIKAKHTLTFQTYKLSHLVAENAEFIGDVHIIDIGLRNEYLKIIEAPELISIDLIKKIYKPRNRFTHKGNFGHAALICGSTGLMGAATLCASACMHSGVGKLTCYIPKTGYEIMQMAVPEAMAKISGERDFIELYDPVSDHECVGIGPGLGYYDLHSDLIKNVFAKTTVPMVIDADAITVLSKNYELLKDIPKNSILTPHPKEFDRLFGEHDNDFQRIETAKEKAKELQCMIVLKGHYSFIATPQGHSHFNSTGNAGMATGGSGDVLTGILTSLLAQGYSPMHATLLGVYLHGLAGDIAAHNLSMEAMVAGDIIKFLPKAFQKISS